MTAGDTIRCRVEKVVYGGDGLARVDGCVVFLPETLPGELVEARVLQAKRSYARAKVLNWLEPSRERISPCCRLSSGERVPGCVYDVVSYPAECALKESQLRETLERAGVLDERCEWRGAVASPSFLHYRNKITLHGGGIRGNVALGYFSEPEHRLVDLPQCPLAMEGINRALADFRASTRFRSFPLRRSIVFRETRKEGAGWFDAETWKGSLPDLLTETTAWGDLRVPLDGFFQVNPGAANLLMNTLGTWFAETAESYSEIVDLFCGVGVLGLVCMRFGGARLVGVESGRRAVAAARENARAWGVNARYETVELGSESFSFSEVIGTLAKTTLLVDPPRGGMAREMAEWVRDSAVPQLFYLSCDPATLARDLKILRQGGYRLHRVQLFDLFPRTARFETLCFLSR